MRFIQLLCSLIFTLSPGDANANELNYSRRDSLVRPLEPAANFRITTRTRSIPKISQSPGISIVNKANYTFYDFQSNGGDENRIVVLPGGAIHIVFMGKQSSKTDATTATRGSYYCYSSDNGKTFTALGRVEPQRAGFPSLDVTGDGRAVIASHTAPAENGLGSNIYVDALPGYNICAEYAAPRFPVEMIWPLVAAPQDDRIVFCGFSSNPFQDASWNALNPNTAKFTFSSNQYAFPGVYDDIHGAVARSSGGKIAFLLLNMTESPPRKDLGENNLLLFESTDRGLSFLPARVLTANPVQTLPSEPAPYVWLGLSAVYRNEELHVVWTQIDDALYDQNVINYDLRNLKILHWSEKVNGGRSTPVVQWDSLYFAGGRGTQPKVGVNHTMLNYPKIGVDQAGVLSVVYVGFSKDALTDPATQILYGDIWSSSSADQGLTWSAPVNLTQSPDMDDRYPYLAKWNESGKVNLFFMTDSVAGNFVGVPPDNAPESRPDFLFLKTGTPSHNTQVEILHQKSLPVADALLQNYPNPFNPTTTIRFRLLVRADVRLEVFNAKGDLLEILLAGDLPGGEHHVPWNGSFHSSGVYFCKLTVDGMVAIQKMLLIR